MLGGYGVYTQRSNEITYRTLNQIIMVHNPKNILSIDSKEAMEFFLKSEQYHGFELPEYFVFDELLQAVKNMIADTPYEECLQKDISPEQLSDVNLDILLNKDGRYAALLFSPIHFCTIFSYVRFAMNSLGRQLMVYLKDLKCHILHPVHCLLFRKRKSLSISQQPF